MTDRSIRSVSAWLVVAVLLPVAALAGTTVSGGGASLQLTTGVKPNKAGAKGVKLSLNLVYKSTVPGKRITASTKEIRFTLPAGMTIATGAAGICSYQKFQQANYDPSVCPKSSQVGSGTFTADARPLIPAPVGGTLKIYNMKGQHKDLLFVAKALGQTLTILFNILPGTKGLIVDAKLAKPAPGQNSLYTLETVNATLANASTGKPYVSAPASCPAQGWPFSLMISTFSSAPALTATDTAACRK